MEVEKVEDEKEEDGEEEEKKEVKEEEVKEIYLTLCLHPARSLPMLSLTTTRTEHPDLEPEEPCDLPNSQSYSTRCPSVTSSRANFQTSPRKTGANSRKRKKKKEWRTGPRNKMQKRHLEHLHSNTF